MRRKEPWNTLALLGTAVLLLVGLSTTGFAQERTVEERQVGPTETKVDTRNATVAYIEGDHLVVRFESGKLEAMQIPSEERFNIDGQELALQELKPGMVLTEEVVSTTRPIVVKTVEITDGTVVFANSLRLVVRTREGKVVDYSIPEWATVNVNGEVEALHQLKHGDHITATIITEEPQTVTSQEKRRRGHAPVAEPEASVATPSVVSESGTKTEEVSEPEKPATVTSEEELPKTASPLPLLGLLGVLSLGISAGLRAVRKVS